MAGSVWTFIPGPRPGGEQCFRGVFESPSPGSRRRVCDPGHRPAGETASRRDGVISRATSGRGCGRRGVLVALDAVDREPDVGERRAVEVLLPGAVLQLLGDRGELGAVLDVLQVGRDLPQGVAADLLQGPGVVGEPDEVLDGQRRDQPLGVLQLLLHELAEDLALLLGVVTRARCRPGPLGDEARPRGPGSGPRRPKGPSISFSSPSSPLNGLVPSRRASPGPGLATSPQSPICPTSIFRSALTGPITIRYRWRDRPKRRNQRTTHSQESLS